MTTRLAWAWIGAGIGVTLASGVACISEPPPPSAPVTPIAVDVPPLASASSSAVIDIPPPNPTPYLPPLASAGPEEPVTSASPSGYASPWGNAPPPAALTASFDRRAVMFALAQVNAQTCAQPGGPTGPGHVTLTFAPDGRVASAVIDMPPFAGTPTGGCLARLYGAVRIPPFMGPAPVRIGKSFVLP